MTCCINAFKSKTHRLHGNDFTTVLKTNTGQGRQRFYCVNSNSIVSIYEFEINNNRLMKLEEG